MRFGAVNYLMIVLCPLIYLTNRLDSIRRCALALLKARGSYTAAGRTTTKQNSSASWRAAHDVERMIVSAWDSLRSPADPRTARHPGGLQRQPLRWPA